MADYANDDEARAFAETLPDSYLQCRDFGHLWRPFTARWQPDDSVWERRIRCVRCYTERVQTLSRSGATISGHYVYPDGYLHATLGRLAGTARDALRLESVTRLAGGTMSGLAKGKGRV